MYNSGAHSDIGAVVADIGSYSSRIGFAGEDFPRSVIRTVSSVFYTVYH